MEIEIKRKFVPEDYEISLHKRLQNLRKRDLDVSTYTKEFHRMTLEEKMPERETQKLARYMNCLKFTIQDELSLFNPESVHKCFQMALRIEEKQKRRGEHNNRGKGTSFRGKGRFNGRGSSPKP